VVKNGKDLHLLSPQTASWHVAGQLNFMLGTYWLYPGHDNAPYEKVKIKRSLLLWHIAIAFEVLNF
jgi:hypothetical protein